MSDAKHPMDEEITGLKSLLHSLAEEAQSPAGAHLAPEKLVDYHFGKLPPDEASRAQSHLAMCHECASQLLDLAAFCAPEEVETSRPSPAEIETAWTALQAQLRIAAPSPRPPKSSAPSLARRLGGLLFPPRPAYALAALSLAIILPLAVWVTSLNRENRNLIARLNQQQPARPQDTPATQQTPPELTKEIEEAQRERDEERARAKELESQVAELRRKNGELTRPQLNAPVVDLIAGGTRAAEGGERQVIELPSGAARFTLVIPAPAQEQNYPSYAIEVTNRRGATIVTGEGLRRDPQSGFTISLPRQQFPAGQYRFRIYGINRGRRTLVLERVAHVRYQ